MPIAIVTGAASGIGRSLANRLVAEGHTVHVADITPSAPSEDETNPRPHRVDVSRPDDWDRLATAVPDVDMLCLNAGITGQSLGLPWETPHEEWNRVLGVNLLGVVGGLRAFLPRMLQRNTPSRILITASLAGLVTFPGGGAYAASKHAVIAVAEQTALALADTAVSVTVVCPALVRSGMSETGADPDDVAARALIAADEGRFLVVDDEWAPAVAERTRLLLTGRPPEMPTPTP